MSDSLLRSDADERTQELETKEAIAMSDSLLQTAIGIEPETQTVTVIFPAPVTYLRLSVEQAESFAKALLEQAKLLKQQIQN